MAIVGGVVDTVVVNDDIIIFVVVVVVVVVVVQFRLYFVVDDVFDAVVLGEERCRSEGGGRRQRYERDGRWQEG